MNKFGIVDGVELSHAATGYTKGTCKKLAHIASRFTPEHRPDGFTRAHFKALLPFQDGLTRGFQQSRIASYQPVACGTCYRTIWIRSESAPGEEDSQRQHLCDALRRSARIESDAAVSTRRGNSHCMVERAAGRAICMPCSRC